MAKKSKHKGRGPAHRPAVQAGGSGPQSGQPASSQETTAERSAPVGSAHADTPPVGDSLDAIGQDVHGDADGAPTPVATAANASVDDGDAASAPVAPRAATGDAPAAMPAPVFDTSPVDVVDSGVGDPDDIRGVLIQLAKARLLLPNATIAEVLSYAEPDAIADAPAWLLGRIRWRGWQLPLVAFSQLAGISDERGGLGSKVVVLKALGGGKTPYFAVLTQGFPRLVTVSRGALVVDESAADLPDILMARVTLNQDDAYLPDLARVEQLIGEALAQAA